MLSLDALPRFAPETVAMSEALRRLLAAVEISLPDTDLRIGGFSECPRKTFEAPVELQIACAQGRVAVTVERATIEAILDAILPEWRDEADTVLPFDWATTLVFDRLSQGTPLTEARLSLRMGPQSLGDVPGFCGMVSVLDRPRLVSVAVLDARPEHPVPRVGGRQRPLPLHLPASIQVSLGALSFDLGELRAVESGDVVLLPGSGPGGMPATVRINAGPAWQGTLGDDGRFTAKSPEKEAPEMDDKEEIMIETLEVAEQATEPEAAPAPEPSRETPRSQFLDLNMTVDFQFRRRTMTLAEIQSLAPGAILDLGLDLTDPIMIRVNDKPVGTGQLVQIGDWVGIQIDRWTEEPGTGWS